MVKAAYSSGKPALGVGAGNTPVIIDDTADIRLAVNSIIHSKTFDNGMICASEQSVTVLEKVYQQVKEEFEYRGCYFLKRMSSTKCARPFSSTAPSTQKNRRSEGLHHCRNGRRHSSCRNQDPHRRSGICRHQRGVCPRKTFPILAMYKAKTFDEAIQKAEQLVADGGYGHTASLYIDTREQKKWQSTQQL